ncbi:MAG: CPBP family intramembrane metalloprotease [Anaeromyxobacter sp.]|nr:CPBP family intramembrane metalloprotease [Anaeromyxobacter sp.]
MLGPAAAAAAYVAIMAVGMAVMHHGFGYAYGQPEMVYVIAPVEVLLTAWAVVAARAHGGWRAFTLGRPRPSGLLWLLPLALPVLAGVVTFALALAQAAPQLTPARWTLLALVAACTALVGFSEELVFRGLLLQGAWRHSGMAHAMRVSALGFALLHAVNLLGGSPPGAVGVQVLVTGAFGLVFAPLAIRLGALWPLMIVHALWDFTLFASAVLPGGQPPAVVLLYLPVALLLAPALWWSLRAHRGLAMADWHRFWRGEPPLA